MAAREAQAIVCIALLLLTVFSVSPSLALHGSQDDAGSGGDAGDTIDDALHILPGVFEGALVYPLDQVDHYAFTVEAGQLISAGFQDVAEAQRASLIGPDGQAYAITFGFGVQPAEFVAHETGIWILKVEGPELSERVDEHVHHRLYRIHLSLSTPEVALSEIVEEPWQSRELSWDEQGTVRVFVWTQTTSRDDAPITVMKATEFWLELAQGGELRGTFFTHSSRTAQGCTIELHAGPLNLSDQDGSMLCEEQGSGGWSLTIFSFQGPAGALRNIAYTTEPDAPTMLVSVVSDVPVEHVAATGSTVFTWNEMDEAAPKLLAPGASVVGPRSLEVVVDDHFLGGFSTWTTNGTIHAPNGDEQRLGPGAFEPLIDAEEGAWRFDLGSSAGASNAAVKNYMTGVLVPTLGVAPDHLSERL